MRLVFLANSRSSTHVLPPARARAHAHTHHTHTHKHTQLEAARVRLDKKDIDYEATLAFKKAFSRKVFDLYGQETLESGEYKVSVIWK